jgi:mRNA-decapping enzyme subunit 2
VPVQSYYAQPSALVPGPAPDDDKELDEDGEQFQDMTLDEVLDDLSVRFVANVQEEEKTVQRLLWQVEEAHWFYEDHVLLWNTTLPTLSQKKFSQILLEHNLRYRGKINFEKEWNEFLSYKKEVPCCGGILLNGTADKALLVRGYKNNSSWCFPRGKINSNESDEACAIREVRLHQATLTPGLRGDGVRHVRRPRPE